MIITSKIEEHPIIDLGEDWNECSDDITLSLGWVSNFAPS